MFLVVISLNCIYFPFLNNLIYGHSGLSPLPGTLRLLLVCPLALYPTGLCFVQYLYMDRHLVGSIGEIFFLVLKRVRSPLANDKKSCQFCSRYIDDWKGHLVRHSLLITIGLLAVVINNSWHSHL